MTLNRDKHKLNIEKVLYAMITNKFWDKLAFKWWTLVYLYYWLDRFSTDLDFDMIWKIDNIEEFMWEIRETLNYLWWTIKEEVNKYNTVFFLYSYWSWEMAIKIEINRRVRLNNKYEKLTLQLNEIWKSVYLNCMCIMSIIWNKMIALTDRRDVVNRDLYDVNFFINRYNIINSDIEALIIERTWKSLKEYLIYLIKYIENNFKSKNLLNWLGDVLNQKKKAWVNNYLLSFTIEKLNEISNKLG